MTQVVLRGGGFLPMTPLAAAPEGNVKQVEPEKEDILVMDTKLKIIEILQVKWFGKYHDWVFEFALFLSPPRQMKHYSSLFLTKVNTIFIS